MPLTLATCGLLTKGREKIGLFILDKSSLWFLATKCVKCEHGRETFNTNCISSAPEPLYSFLFILSSFHCCQTSRTNISGALISLSSILQFRGLLTHQLDQTSEMVYSRKRKKRHEEYTSTVWFTIATLRHCLFLYSEATQLTVLLWKQSFLDSNL